MVPFRYNVRSLFVRKVTTFASVFGIALVVFVFAAALMLNEGVNRAVVTGGRPENVIILRKGSDAELSSAIANNVLGLFGDKPQISRAEGVIGEIIIVITAEHDDGSGSISNVLIRGTSPEGIKFRPEVKLVSGHLPKPGTNEVIVGVGISGRFKGIGPGKSFEIRRNRPLVVVGEFTSEGSSYESEVWGDLDVIRKALGRDAVVSSARVRLNQAEDFDAYRTEIEGDKNFSMKVMRESDYFRKASEQTADFLTNMGLAIAIMFSIAAMIGAAITMNGAVAHRSREIGTLRALGFSRFSILISFVFEAIFLAALGGLVGSICVLILSLISFPVMNFQTFSEIVITFKATPAVFLKALIFSSVMGLIGGLVPAIRAARISPVEAMRA
jgi:putative ABC transport system permease protein